MQIQKLREIQSIQGYWLMGALAAMVGTLGQGIADTVMYRPQISTLWWLAIAIVASYSPTLGQGKGRDFEIVQ